MRRSTASRSTGELDLGFAILEGSTTFSAMSGTGTLVLERLCLCLPPGDGRRAPQLLMSKMTLDGLVMDLDLVPAVRGSAVALDVLEVVEATARRDGDTGTANRAHFDLLTRRNDELAQPERFLDAAFYGGAAGYLVRPRNPLLCLLALLVLGGLIRAWPRVAVALRRLRPAPGAISPPVSRLGAARLLFVSVVVALCQGAFADAEPIVERPEAPRTRSGATPVRAGAHAPVRNLRSSLGRVAGREGLDRRCAAGDRQRQRHGARARRGRDLREEPCP